jgi:hypothetical protein
LVLFGRSFALDTATPSRWAKLGSSVLHEFPEVAPPTVFFFVRVNLVLFTKHLFLLANGRCGGRHRRG